jgi:predicted transposase YbfD/YdcC
MTPFLNSATPHCKVLFSPHLLFSSSFLWSPYPPIPGSPHLPFQVYVPIRLHQSISFIPALLGVLELEGLIVTIDAMGCQKAIAEKIVDKGADYVLGLKGNQGNLHAEVNLFFQDCLTAGFQDFPYDCCETVDGDHGRIETRRYWTTSPVDWLPDKALWKNMFTLVIARRERLVHGKVSLETSDCISSLG